MSESTRPFLTIPLEILPRILGFIDRERDSSTYGCCDRYYWHYRLHDVANARFQEAALLLAMLYSRQVPGNRFHGRAKLGEWALGCVGYWLGKRNRDGSCVEVYPNERSVCATSFSTFSVVQTLLELERSGGKMAERVRVFVRESQLDGELRRTAGWIRKNLSKDVGNQKAAALVALSSVSALLDDDTCSQQAQDVFAGIADTVQRYGYLPEYGGFDLGYASISNSCLAWFAESGCVAKTEVDRVARVTMGRMDDLIDSHGNYDCGDMSRRTQFLYPFGFASFGSPALEKILRGLGENVTIGPHWLDDRYCIAMAIDYLKTHLFLNPDDGSRGATEGGAA